MRVNKPFHYNILNISGENIPQNIARIVYMRSDERIRKKLREREYQLKISEMFVWKKTPEGHDIWDNVDKGDYQPFYDFHKAQKAK